MFPIGAVRRIEAGNGRGEAPRPQSSAVRPAEVVWVHEGPVCVTIVDEPQRKVHGDDCRCDDCQASLRADPAADFLPDASGAG